MTDFELHDRPFEWRYVSGSPLHIELIENEEALGKVWKPANDEPVERGLFLNTDWHLLLGDDRYVVADDPDSPGVVEASRNSVGHIVATVDGVAKYDLVSPTPHDLVWRDRDKAIILRFHRFERGNNTIPGGTISFFEEADPSHGPALLILGIALIYEIDPFTTGTHSYFVD